MSERAGRAGATIALTALTLVAFASNSLLARVALRGGEIDAAGFTAVRLLSGAALLWLVVLVPRRGRPQGGSGGWVPGLMLFAYAILFSLAYLQLTAGTGALVLFGAVQVTMISVGLWEGDRLRPMQVLGAALAASGLVYLAMPGVEAPPLGGALLMAGSGIAWGVYSLLGRSAGDPASATAVNFLWAAPMGVGAALALLPSVRLGATGVAWAALSGGVTSGLGYVLWYLVLPRLGSLRGAVAQLAVPVLAAVGGATLLTEEITARLVVATAVTLGGVALALRRG